MNKFLLFLLILPALTFSQEYNRKDWKHWIDEDKNGFNTRQEVLIEENLADSLEIIWVNNKFKIIKGMWVCPFTGDTITNPKKLDVDHLIPLKYAHDHGAAEWTKDKKEKYANYLNFKDHLVAVKASANRQKGAKGPDKWIPNINRIWYKRKWRQIKRKWRLNDN